MSKYNNLQNMIQVSSVAGKSIVASKAGEGLDCKNYEDLLVVAKTGTVAATSVITLSIQHSDDNGVSDAYANVTGAVINVADSDDDTAYMGKVRLNTANMKRWVRVHAIVATAAGEYSIYAMAYNKGGALPIANTLAFDVNLGVV